MEIETITIENEQQKLPHPTNAVEMINNNTNITLLKNTCPY